jgi:hypothetical protein
MRYIHHTSAELAKAATVRGSFDPKVGASVSVVSQSKAGATVPEPEAVM